MENLGNFGLEGNIQEVRAGCSNINQIFLSRLMNLCAASAMNLPLKPLSVLGEREAQIISECEYLIKFFNTRNIHRQELAQNWKDNVTYFSPAEFNERQSLFEPLRDRFFTDPNQNFIFKWKNFLGKQRVLKNFEKQISTLVLETFFLNFVYKFSLNENSLEIRDIDQQLEQISGTVKFHPELYTPLLLQKAKDCMTGEIFCHKCGISFDSVEKILPHCAKYHPDLVDEEEVEAVKSARESRRLEELTEAQKCRHANNHPECSLCFRD